MKKIISILMCLLITALFTKVVPAEERIVQLTVPNCSS